MVSVRQPAVRKTLRVALILLVTGGGAALWPLSCTGCEPPPPVVGDGDGDVGPGPGDGDGDYVDVDHGLEARVPGNTCLARPRPPTGGTYGLERAFPGLVFEKPVAMLQAPGDDERWYVVEQPGRVLRFPDREDVTSAEVEVFVDMRGVVDDGPPEAGLLGLAFHPDFVDNRLLFLSYTTDEGGLVSRISRFRTVPDPSSLGGGVVEPVTEEILLSLRQPFGNHNGGDIHYGPDGHLYISFGDGGAGGDPLNHGQQTGSWFGAILRIAPDDGVPYAIPATNPFAGGEGGLPEIYAWGFRNVWRFSFDRATGELWAGDVGQGEWEEVDVVERGGNYGWSIKEGTHCFGQDPCEVGGLLDPIVEYSHTEGRSITGGYVYRGPDLAGLVGSYVYADYQFGTVWALRFDPVTGEAAPEVLTQTNYLLSSFGEANDGRLFVLRYRPDGDGEIHRVVAIEPPPPDDFPTSLVDTGCVDPDDPTRLHPSVIPYGVQVELWSDGAAKTRGLSLPDDAALTVDDDGRILFPPGTVLVKTFSLEGQPVETRLLMLHDDGDWAGYSYAWAEDGSDATLLPAGATREVSGQTWTFPSRRECLACHTEVKGRVLGVELRQLGGRYVYPGGLRAPQLDTLAHIGALTGEVPGSEPFPSLLSEAPIAERARAYLDVNCAHCHQPGGTGQGPLDLRAETPLTEMRAVCTVAQEGDLGQPGGQIITPGAPPQSLLLLRMRRTDATRMPDLGSALIDPLGTQLVDAWIETITECP